jgi:hypothetical protein
MKRYVLSYVLRDGTTWDIYESDEAEACHVRMRAEKALARMERTWVVRDRGAQ